MVHSPLRLLSNQPRLMLVIAGDLKTFPMLLLPRLELNTTINRMFMVPAHLRRISRAWIPCHKEVKSRRHLANDPTKMNHFIGMAANGLVMNLPDSKGSVAVVLTSKTLLDVAEVQAATTTVTKRFLHHKVMGLVKSEVFDLALTHKATRPPTRLTTHQRLLVRISEADEVAAEVATRPYQHGSHSKMVQLLLLHRWNVLEVVHQLSLILGLVVHLIVVLEAAPPL